MTARYAIDTSAYLRASIPAVRNALLPLIAARQVAVCSIVELEIFFSARGARDLTSMRRELNLGFDRIPTEQADFDRAADIMELLARTRQHRSAKVPDLLLAAVAERAGLVILHYDEDFDRIAAVTGQPAKWVVPRGSI